MLRLSILTIAVMVSLVSSPASADFLRCDFFYDLDNTIPWLEVTMIMSGFNQFHDKIYIHDVRKGTRHKESLESAKVHGDLLYGFYISKEDPEKTMMINVYKEIEKGPDGKERWKAHLYPPNAIEDLATGLCWPEYTDD